MGNNNTSSPLVGSSEPPLKERVVPPPKEPSKGLPKAPKSGALFSQFPDEINVFILNMLDAETLLKTSRTCKRWLNNTKYLENLSLVVTHKQIREQIDDGRWVKRPQTRLAKINWKPMEATLNRFTPECLRFLNLHPDLQQNNEVINNFISRATNLTKLVVSSSYHMDAILQLPNDHMKEIDFSGLFDSRCTHFTNLESLGFQVRHDRYEQFDLLQLRGFRNLTKLSIRGLAAPYVTLEQLGQLVNLTELDIDYAYLADEEFVHLGQFTNLEKLRMGHLQKEIPIDDTRLDMSEAIMPEIGNSNPIIGLRHLTTLINLVYLDVSYVQKVFSLRRRREQEPEGYDVADLVIKHFTKLKEIDISCTALGKTNRQKLKEISWLRVIDNKDPYNMYNVDDSQNGEDSMDELGVLGDD